MHSVFGRFGMELMTQTSENRTYLNPNRRFPVFGCLFFGHSLNFKTAHRAVVVPGAVVGSHLPRWNTANFRSELFAVAEVGLHLAEAPHRLCVTAAAALQHLFDWIFA